MGMLSTGKAHGALENGCQLPPHHQLWERSCAGQLSKDPMGAAPGRHSPFFPSRAWEPGQLSPSPSSGSATGPNSRATK